MQTLYLPILLIAVTLFCPLQKSLDAEIVSYSWGGQIFLKDGATSDPWNVGSGGNFEATWLIDTNAVDENKGIENARYAANLGSFEIDGQSVTNSNEVQFLLSDNSGSPVSDSITGRGELTFNGVSQDVVTTLKLAPNSFSLTAAVQTIPNIVSGVAIDDSGASNVQSSNFYILQVSAGEQLLSSVPEPGSIALIFLGFMAVGIRRR